MSHEIQTLRDGRWRVNAVFESVDLALGRAAAMAERPDVPPLRVVQEKFGGGGKSVLRVMYESRGYGAAEAAMEEALVAAGLDVTPDGDVDQRGRRRLAADLGAAVRGLFFYLGAIFGLGAIAYAAFLLTLLFVGGAK